MKTTGIAEKKRSKEVNQQRRDRRTRLAYSELPLFHWLERTLRCHTWVQQWLRLRRRLDEEWKTVRWEIRKHDVSRGKPAVFWKPRPRRRTTPASPFTVKRKEWSIHNDRPCFKSSPSSMFISSSDILVASRCSLRRCNASARLCRKSRCNVTVTKVMSHLCNASLQFFAHHSTSYSLIHLMNYIFKSGF